MLDRVPVRNPARVGDQFVLAADFHVHAFVGDGGVPPWELGREARRRGLDVIVVSNHNQLLAARLSRYGTRLYGSSTNGDRRRGADRASISHGRRRHRAGRSTGGCPQRKPFAAIHEQGGVAIAAHPGRQFWRAYDNEARALLDGAEVAHPAARRSRRGPARACGVLSATRREINPSLAPIGSSDFHFGGDPRRVPDVRLCRRVHRGRRARGGARVEGPWHPTGTARLTGDPARVRTVRGLLAADAAPRCARPGHRALPHGSVPWSPDSSALFR